MEKSARTTKKQRELLAFIDAFIKSNNYGPSYREIMRALGYRSVSTVATHVDGLIAKGYLHKTDNSARSIQVMQLHAADPQAEYEQWLVGRMNETLQQSSIYKDAFVTTLKALDIDPRQINQLDEKMTKA